MICRNCGAEVQDSYQPFCLKCRTPLIHIEKDLQELLDSGNVRIYVDGTNRRIWIWIGSNIDTRKKFKSVNLAPNIQDRKGIQYQVVSVQEGNEPPEFLDFIQEK